MINNDIHYYQEGKEIEKNEGDYEIRETWHCRDEQKGGIGKMMREGENVTTFLIANNVLWNYFPKMLFKLSLN